MIISTTRRLYTLSFIFLLICCVTVLSVNAQENTKALYLKDITLNPTPNTAKWIDSITKQHIIVPLQVIIQFYQIPGQQERTTMLNAGVKLQDYIPDNAFVTIIEQPTNIAVLKYANIKAIINIEPEWKADGYLWRNINSAGNNIVEILIAFNETINAQTIRTFIEQSGGKIDDNADIEKYGGYKVNIPASKVRNIARWYGVKYISPVSANVLLDYRSKGMEKANISALPRSVGGYDLQGDGVTVGVGDNGSAIYHADTRDRVINYNPAPIAHHGQHINGIVGGAGNIDPNAEGVAPHVTLVDHLYENVVFQAGVMLHDHNVNVTNSSYALTEGQCDYDGIYDFYSNALDKIAQQYPTVGHVFAAGNDGGLHCTPYPDGFGTIIGGYQTAKNTIVVTSTDKMYNNAWDGSRGPTRDRRLKPDMTANGVDVFSLIGVDVYSIAGGTSMASPQVAGAYALLTQRYRQLFGSGLNPRSDLMKAILVNGATDIGNAGPDYRFGFGFLNLNHSLQMLDSTRYITNAITTGVTQSFSINVPANTAQVKVMLYWHDTAASPIAAHQLINDLDLVVVDGSFTSHRPLVLDTTLANINNDAKEKEDHVNNCEQVTINYPASGSYIVSVKGYNVPSLSQPYVVTYDFIPVGVQLTYPHKGDVIKANDSFQVYWEASNDSNAFTLEYSDNLGAVGSWKIIDNNIERHQLQYTWHVPNINSNKIMMRLSRNGTSVQSVAGPFVVNIEPHVTLDSVQCPGYIHINWDTNANATTFEVLRKIGPYMKVVDTVTANTYTFKGLSQDSIYYVAVRPLIASTRGFRSLATRYQPNRGNCSGSISDGDLQLTRILGPNSGRKFTSSQLGANEDIVLMITNLDDVPCSNYKVSYKLNSGVWSSSIQTKTISARGSVIDTIHAGLNLFAAGNYKIQVAITNLAIADHTNTNDTLIRSIINLNNNLINLASSYVDDFETMPALYLERDSMGISPNEHWDYSRTVDTAGRLRSFVNDSITVSGNRSISLDANQTLSGNTNYFTGTFNLANYNAAVDEIRMQFDYVLHGKPKSNIDNQVWVHGYDNQSWGVLYNYNTSSPGQVMHSGSLSMSDVIYNNHQSFSPSFQVRFGQSDTSLIASRNFGNGLTIDNFKIYTVKNDVQLLSIVSPGAIECGAVNNVPITVEVYNSVRQVQNSVGIYYQLDGGAIVSDTLASISGKDTVFFNFTIPMSSLSYGSHTLNAWLAASGDTYTANDTILNYKFHNQPIISTYPYLQDFETSDGSWYTEGQNSSWQYGTPASQKIHKAASGTKAWKTNLTGHYNDREISYLYSPCFNISDLTKPMLSFSFAMELEKCGSTLCDYAYLEYSFDGANWEKLGTSGQGTNWYGNSFNLWNDDKNTYWHVASIPLPVSTQPIRLRFVMGSDPAVNHDGIAIDDIHIFDLKEHVYNGQTTNVVTLSFGGNEWNNYATSSGIWASANAESQIVPALSAKQYTHDTIYNSGQSQYYFPRSYVVNYEGDALPTDSIGVRLFVPDEDVVAMLNDTACPSCSRAEDAYSMGITKYENDITHEDGTLSNNEVGSYTYLPYQSIKWVPYDNGYYAQLKMRSFSELWFNDGGPTGNFPVGANYLFFTAKRADFSHVQLNWRSLIDTAINVYEVQRGDDGINFTSVGSVTPYHIASAAYSYIDSPQLIVNNMLWYRLRYTMQNGKVYFSPARRIDWTDVNQVKVVYPNPNTGGTINIQWSANTGAEMKLSISDISGRVVYTTSVIATEWNNTSTITTPHFGKGVYILRTDIGINSFITKLVYR